MTSNYRKSYTLISLYSTASSRTSLNPLGCHVYWSDIIVSCCYAVSMLLCSMCQAIVHCQVHSLFCFMSRLNLCFVLRFWIFTIVNEPHLGSLHHRIRLLHVSSVKALNLLHFWCKVLHHIVLLCFVTF